MSWLNAAASENTQNSCYIVMGSCTTLLQSNLHDRLFEILGDDDVDGALIDTQQAVAIENIKYPAMFVYWFFDYLLFYRLIYFIWLEFLQFSIVICRIAFKYFFFKNYQIWFVAKITKYMKN